MRMSTIDVGMRLGDAIDPFQLVNGFEVVIGTNAKNGKEKKNFGRKFFFSFQFERAQAMPCACLDSFSRAGSGR